MEPFAGRRLVIATMHGKEAVIAPPLEAALGVRCLVPAGFDSDALGTFTGEVEREQDPVSTVRRKCQLAMQLTGTDLAVASEGSFGPHPALFAVGADEEWLVLIDARHNLEIVVRELSLDTNYNGRLVSSEEELQSFAETAGFPAHGLILRPERTVYAPIFKGITEAETLRKHYAALSAGGRRPVYVETDMRALYNPTRQAVIGAAAARLAATAARRCPGCQTPGFAVAEARRGLPCGLCGAPTRSVLSYVYRCQKCAYEQDEPFPQGKHTEDPMYCDECNP